MIDLCIALLFNLAGMALLFMSWRKYLPILAMKVYSGWLLQIVALYFWIRFGGPEFGLVYGFAALALVAWLFTVFAHERREARAEQVDRETRRKRRRQLVLRDNLLIFIMAVPLAGIAATLLSITGVLPLPLSELHRWVLAIFMVPVLWGCLTYWVCADRRPARPLAGMLLGSSLCAVTLYL